MNLELAQSAVLLIDFAKHRVSEAWSGCGIFSILI